ncbi:Mannosylglycerate hydrolase [Anaerohalosphaera lusitana]|uniref:alpha-mannosidase n=1 Tax=Anaerohalosphaera lusitana TaxID=1936003 RepID=A0A1U9NJX3_9BACT|nr:alpha-mannosidase [Anaerohalosphaera lusitana]AQT68107.1 Mannosylglycerate hydrolase [Anaerohalosphaera lusitana]
MKHEKRLTLAKLQTRLRLIEPLVCRARQAVEPFKYLLHENAAEKGHIGLDVDDSNWDRIEPGTYWGQWYSNFTLRSRFTVPAEWADCEPVALSFNIGEAPGWDFCHPEALVHIDGKPLAGLDKYHKVIYLPKDCIDGEEHLLSLDGYTGRWGIYEGTSDVKLLMQGCDVVSIDTETRDFVAVARMALDCVTALDVNNPARERVLNSLDEAFRCLNLREPLAKGFYASVPEAHKTLTEGIARAGNPLDVNISAIGHSHIDAAWVWPLAQTRKKCGRSFHTVLSLMNEFDEYIFTQSQPQLYEYVKQDHPELFESIREKVRQGKWETVGGMWVEADCNITGPESLARQFLLGRRFFTEHFGKGAESPVLWLPDVFGYAYNLPQIMKLAGLEYFFTTKMSWNRYNQMPYDTFMWEGLDGTQVLTHLGTTKSGDWVTYNGTAKAEELLNTWTNCRQKECHSELMTCFGHGDGGGGPTREMLENIANTANFPSMPRVKHGKVIDFFKKLEKKCGSDLPKWNGELYLEGHRGTYTTQANNKKANRRSEFALHDAEWLASLAALTDNGYAYPYDELTRAWKLVCLNQFHDIIPGSSIGEVYEDSLEQYAQVEQITDEIKKSALNTLSSKMNSGLIVANPTSFCRTDLAWLDTRLNENETLTTSQGEILTTQNTEDGTLIDLGRIEEFSIQPLTISSKDRDPIRNTLTVSQNLLENKFLKIELNTEGDITSIYDKISQRQVLSENAIGNQLQAFEDRPIDWDAWDIDIFYNDKMWLANPADSVKVAETGPLRATLEIKRKILNSSYTQRISLTRNSPAIEFTTEIDWQEKHVLLKAAFPVEILSDVATYEIQWGHVDRPTHHNTSWDWAKFEVCAQKWVDLSEGDYGVSLLNDCKYGHDIRDNIIRITLLRSPTMPDPCADTGRHSFRYTLLPHSGKLSMETVRRAYALNDPLIVHRSDNPTTQPKRLASMVRLDRENVFVETIKQAEDGSGIIVRLYEAAQCRGPVELTAGFELASCYVADLLENNKEQLETDGRKVRFNIRPFQIITLRLVPAKS